MLQTCKYTLFKLPDSHREAVDLRSFPSEEAFPTGRKKLYFQGHTLQVTGCCAARRPGGVAGGRQGCGAGRAPYLNKSRKHAKMPPKEGY